MAIYKIIKRNGAIVTFDKSKINNAIYKAMIAAKQENTNIIDNLTSEVIAKATETYGDKIPNVESIQDIVEQVLIENNCHQTAKAYIIYREKRSEAREDKNVMVEVKKSMEEYLEQSDWRVNANANS